MTINYICYLSNGKITKVGSASEQDAILNVAENESILYVSADLHSQYVANSVVVNMPIKPDGEYVFNYNTKQWEFDTVTADYKARQQRDSLLANGPDRISPMWWSSMTTEDKQAWTDYRQALLDIPSQPNYPQEIVWPTKP